MSDAPLDEHIPAPPAPAELQDLLEALRSAAHDVGEARAGLEARAANQLAALRTEAERHATTAREAAETHARALQATLDESAAGLAKLTGEAESLISRLDNALSKTHAAITRAESSIDQVRDAIANMKRERDNWDKQTEAIKKRQDQATAKLQEAFDGAVLRIERLEKQGQRLDEKDRALETRLQRLADKKLVGWMFR